MELWDVTICDILKKNVREIPDQAAYYADDSVYTWHDTDRISDAIAISLYQRGIRRGTHVGIWGVNTIQWVMYYFALQKIGALSILLNYSFKSLEMTSILNYNDVVYLLIGDSKPELDYWDILKSVKPSLNTLRETVDMNDEFQALKDTEVTSEDRDLLGQLEGAINCHDASTVIFTSGTTARPKGVLLSHFGIVNDARAVAAGMHWSTADKQVLAMPMFHCSGLTCGIVVSMCIGYSSVLVRYFSPKAVMTAIETHHCTIFNAVPSMLLIMRDHPDREKYDLSTYCSGTLGGSNISAEDYASICETFKLKNLLAVYGQTECSPIVCMSTYGDAVDVIVNSIGKPIDGIQMRIWKEEHQREATSHENGEIQVKGFCIMNGYYNRPEYNHIKFTDDGWLRTGDIGSRDDAGYYHFVCRSDDMIIRGGENIAPCEIECCVKRSVEQAEIVRVVGVQAPTVQEEIVAFIKAPVPVDPNAVRTYVKRCLASFKTPKYVFQLEEFPMTASGKIDDKALRLLAKKLVYGE